MRIESKALILIGLLTIPLLSEVGIADNLIKGNANTEDDVVLNGGVGRVVSVGQVQPRIKKVKKVFYKKNWTREKIFNVIKTDKNTEKSKFSINKGEGDMFIDPQFLADNEHEIKTYYLNQNANETLNQRIMQSLKGDCIIPYKVDVAVEPIQVKMTCKILEDNSFIDLIMMLVPSNKTYSLIAIPKYYVSSKGDVIPIDKQRSYITNFADTTSNIATYVNTQEVKKNLTFLAQGIGTSMSRTAEEYLQERAASRREQELIVSGGINPVVVQSTNTREPSIKEYTVAGLVGGVFEGIGKMATNMQGDFPYLYRVEKGSRINFFVTPLIITDNKRDLTENGRMR